MANYSPCRHRPSIYSKSHCALITILLLFWDWHTLSLSPHVDVDSCRDIKICMCSKTSLLSLCKLHVPPTFIRLRVHIMVYPLGGVVPSWLVHLTVDQMVWFWALARDIVFSSWARHFTLTVPLSTQVHL